MGDSDILVNLHCVWIILHKRCKYPFNVLVLIPDDDKLKKKPTSPDSGSDTAPKKR